MSANECIMLVLIIIEFLGLLCCMGVISSIPDENFTPRQVTKELKIIDDFYKHKNIKETTMKDNTKDLLIEQLEKQNDKLIIERDKLELINNALVNQLLEVTRTLNSCEAELKETKNKQKENKGE